jgi:hypothetical protein
MSDFIDPDDALRASAGNPSVEAASESDAIHQPAVELTREPLRDVSAESGGEPLPAPGHEARQETLNAPMRLRIAELQLEHRDLDDVIDRLADQPGVDDLRLRRLKKRKLQIRDSLERLQMSITPDIPA